MFEQYSPLWQIVETQEDFVFVTNIFGNFVQDDDVIAYKTFVLQRTTSKKNQLLILLLEPCISLTRSHFA